MAKLSLKSSFIKDLKKYDSKKNITRAVGETIRILEKGPPYPPNFYNKPLKGFKGLIGDCHAQGDIVIIYEKYPDRLVLTRVGSHSELYKA